MRNIGSSFGTSLLTAMWTHRSSAYAADLAGRVQPGRAPVEDYLNRLHALGLVWLARPPFRATGGAGH